MKTPRKRRWWLWIPMSLIGVFLFAVLLLLTNPTQTYLAKYIFKKVNPDISGKLSFDKVEFNLAGKVVLENVNLKDSLDETLISAELLTVFFDPFAIFQDTIHIQLLKLDSVRVNFASDSTGKSNIQTALTPKHSANVSDRSPKPFVWKILLDSLQVNSKETYVVVNQRNLLSSSEWTANGHGKYQTDSLIYALSLSASAQADISTSGQFALNEKHITGSGEFQAGLSKKFTSNLMEPVNRLGDIATEGSFKLASDSVFLYTEISSSETGTINSNVRLSLPLGNYSGSGDIVFENFQPASLYHDTTNVILNGALNFIKTEPKSFVNGWNLNFDLKNSHYGRYQIQKGIGTVKTVDSTASLNSTLTLEQGTLSIIGSVNGFDPNTMSANGKLNFDNLVLHDLIPQIPDSLSPLNGELDLTAKNFTLEKMQAKAELTLDKISLGKYSADNLALKATLYEKEFVLDSALFTDHGDSLLFFAQGTLGDSLFYQINLSMQDVKRLTNLLPQFVSEKDSLAGSLRLSLKGTASLTGDSLSHLTSTGNISLGQLHYQETILKKANIKLFNFNLDSMAFLAGIRAVEIKSYGQIIDSVFIAVSGTPNNFDTDFSLWAKADTIFAYTESKVKIDEKDIQLGIQKIFARTYGTEWKVEEPVNIAFADGKLEVDALRITSPLGKLLATGFLQKNGEQDLVLEISGLETAELAQILKKSIPSASVNLRLMLQGPDTALIGDVSITADSVKLEDKELADQIYFHGSITKEQSDVDGYSIWFGDTLFTIIGILPLKLTYNKLTLQDSLPISGSLRILKQPLDKLNPYLPYGCKSDGIFRGDFTFSGTPRHPNWNGDFSLDDGKYYDPLNGVDYKKAFVSGSLRQDTLSVTRCDVEAGGTLKGSGTAIMRFPLPKSLDLDMTFRKFQAVHSKQMEATVSGNAKISGALDSLYASGKVTLDETNYRVTQATTKNVEDIDLEGILAELRGDTTKPQGFLVRRAYKTMSHDLELNIPGNCWIRGGGMNVELSGKLYLNKLSKRSPEINGQIDVNTNTNRSTIQFYGRELKVTEGFVRYDGLLDNPSIDFTAYEPQLTEQNADTIYARLFGTLQNSQFELRDQLNKFTQEQLILLMILGVVPELAQSDSAITNENLQQRATSAAAGQLSGLIAKAAGLDLFDYKPGEGGLTSGTLEVGTYVTPRLFVKIKQPVEISQAGQELDVEYQLFKWLKLAGKQTGGGQSALDLIFQVEWR